MPPFVRVKVVKCELGSTLCNGSNSEYFPAVNIKEYVVENGECL